MWDDVVWTKHAEKRWGERFPDVEDDKNCLLRLSRPPGKAIRRRLKYGYKIAKSARKIRAGRKSIRDTWYTIAPGGVVFVMCHPRVVVTVFKLEKRCKQRELLE